MAPVLQPGAEMWDRAERRDTGRRQQLVNRVQSEFSEMPGLRLTLGQATRLLALEADPCRRILNELVQHGFLRQGIDGTYLRQDVGP